MRGYRPRSSILASGKRNGRATEQERDYASYALLFFDLWDASCQKGDCEAGYNSPTFL